MEKIELIKKQIIDKVNGYLGKLDFNAEKFVENAINLNKLMNHNCVYGTTAHHPIDFNFQYSNMGGSYLLGPCSVKQSIIYKSDIRGDELKCKGDILDDKNPDPLLFDEKIVINSSLLYKTLVHNNSNNSAAPEEFSIRNTVSCHYANIHGATTQSSFLGAFSTIDLMNMNSCVVGEFSYVQAGDLFQEKIDPGVIYIKSNDFCFQFKYKKEVIDKYIGVNDLFQPRGLIHDFISEKEAEFDTLFNVINIDSADKTPDDSAVNQYAIIKGDTKIGSQVLVSQKAYLENAQMGDGSNAQENTYIINSTLSGMNVTAHGGKIINADIGFKTFVGFNSFLSGKENARLQTGKNCIVMPHTIIDISSSLKVPDNSIVWGFIASEQDLKTNSITIEELKSVNGTIDIGDMNFQGKGNKFVDAFGHRIEHILEANGACCDDDSIKGHAQYDKEISFNILQVQKSGENRGLYPSIRVRA
jgi:carbonic anhydrase/acetyltransferase-like protein (isoleucine patch superfamily)